MMTEVGSSIELCEKLNGPLEGLGETVLEAATSRWPKARYVCGYDAQLIRFLVMWLPSWLTDAFFAAMHRKVHRNA